MSRLEAPGKSSPSSLSRSGCGQPQSQATTSPGTRRPTSAVVPPGVFVSTKSTSPSRRSCSAASGPLPSRSSHPPTASGLSTASRSEANPTGIASRPKSAHAYRNTRDGGVLAAPATSRASSRKASSGSCRRSESDHQRSANGSPSLCAVSKSRQQRDHEPPIRSESLEICGGGGQNITTQREGVTQLFGPNSCAVAWVEPEPAAGVGSGEPGGEGLKRECPQGIGDSRVDGSLC